MIQEFNEIEARKSGIIYKSTFNQIKSLYHKDPLLAGELAISAIELVLTGEYSSDNDIVGLCLESNKVVNERNQNSYDLKVEKMKADKISKLKLEEIATLSLQKMTQKSIAQKLGLTQQTVSNRLTIIRKEFPELLQVEEDNKPVQTCTNFVQAKNTCTNLQEENACTSKKSVCTSNTEFVQEKYNTFNF